MKLTWPNVLSLSRIPIGILVAIAGAIQTWDWALALYLAGCGTDLADGYVAKRWNCGSEFGANVLEPVCDMALTVGALTGLVVSHQISVALVFAMAVVAVVVQVINSFFKGTVLFRKFGMWFMPIYFLFVTACLVFFFASLALGLTAYLCFAVLAIIIGGKLVSAKSHRLEAWFGDSP